MIDQQEIQTTVREFIQKNFIFDPTTVLVDGESLLGSGVIDSTGVLKLIGYLEEKFQLTFEDSELIGENFDTILKITAFLQKKIDKHS
jgi:acyl carrier protein